MLNREEYNVAFKTTLSQEEFDEIMGKPITDLSEVEELVIADRKGNVWRFLPKANAILIEWIKDWQNRNEWKYQSYFTMRDGKPKYAIECLIEDWEKENVGD